MIASVKFYNEAKCSFFDVDGYEISVNDDVIVQNDRGLMLGHVCEIREQGKDYVKIDRIVRKALFSDHKKYNRNLRDAEYALKVCQEKVTEYNLNMKILDASYSLNREQLMFRFLSDSRVDFRQLARDLGSIFKTRIELRQVGIRDKAREFGGIGPCGRILCCNKFLSNFDSVSINMAKNQNLALNPSKINGVCGRLLCCLKYENNSYSDYKKGLPVIGKMVMTADGEGKVLSVDLFKRSYRVLLSNNDIVEIKDE